MSVTQDLEISERLLAEDVITSEEAVEKAKSELEVARMRSQKLAPSLILRI